MPRLRDDGPGLTEAEKAIRQIIWICEQARRDSDPTWVQYGPEIETVARTYFHDQLSRESHEFETSSEEVHYVWWQRLLHAAGLYRHRT